jgi:hypothetical protein
MKSSQPSRTTPIAPAGPAAEIVGRWRFVQSRLAPIIGEDGFRILYARSLHRARLEHPWLAREPQPGNDAFSALKASLEAEAPERATGAGRALMGHFIDLLHTLIGEALASRLLRPS